MIKRLLAVTLSLALVVTAAAAIKFTKSVSADDAVTLVPWTFYEGAASFRSGDDPWAQRFYSSVQVGNQTIGGWGSADEVTEEMEQTASSPSDSFTANIVTTGWDGNWQGGSLVGDNPWLLRAYMDDVQVIKGHMYTLSFNAKWTNTTGAPEKNIEIGIENQYGESIYSKYYPQKEHRITVPTGTTKSYTFEFTNYDSETFDIKLAYGAFLYSGPEHEGITTEGTNAKGKLEITGFTLTDRGQDPDVPTDPPKPTTTAKPTQAPTEAPTGGPTQAPTQAPTVAPQPTQAPVVTTKAPTTEVKKLAKVKGVKVKNTKKKTIKVSWKKVKYAKKYQIKIGNKTYKSSKTSKKIKNKKFKKGKKIKVKVRATATGYKTGAWSRTVKKKLTK